MGWLHHRGTWDRGEIVISQNRNLLEFFWKPRTRAMAGVVAGAHVSLSTPGSTAKSDRCVCKDHFSRNLRTVFSLACVPILRRSRG